ncbi:MAG: hypothetical protein ACFFBP_18685 [Promethearchaeota archaeon]
MLGPEEFIEGLFSLLYVFSTTSVGILLISRYFKYKEKSFIFIGLSVAGISCPWWPSSVSFLSHALFEYKIPDQVFFFIGNAFIPLFLFSWIIGMNILLFDGKNKIFVISYAILLSVMEIVFLLILFVAPPNLILLLIGSLDEKNLNAEYEGFIFVLLIIIVITIFTTGLLMSRKLMKANKPVIQLRGKLMLIGFIIWSVAATIDTRVPLEVIGVIIVRTLLIISAIDFYFGWVMPEFMQKFFRKVKILKK